MGKQVLNAHLDNTAKHVPDGGNVGQVVVKGSDGNTWQNADIFDNTVAQLPGNPTTAQAAIEKVAAIKTKSRTTFQTMMSGWRF